MLTSIDAVLSEAGSNTILPCKPEKLPSTLNPKFFILNVTLHAVSTGTCTCPKLQVQKVSMSITSMPVRTLKTPVKTMINLDPNVHREWFRFTKNIGCRYQ